MERRIIRGTPRSTWDAPPLTLAPDEVKSGAMFRRAMAMADEIGLNDDKRHSLALMIPGVDKDGAGSWKELDAKQLHDLNCMLDGWVWITHLKQEDVD